MDSLRVNCFLAVAELRSFSKAAEQLFKNQSVVSRQIQAMEQELGVQLFYRNSKEVVLTPAGRIVQKNLSSIGNHYRKMLDDARATQSGYIGELRICTHPGSIYCNTLVPIILAFEKEHPDIQISMRCEYSGNISRQLNEQHIDLAFWRWEEYADSNRDSLCVSAIRNGLVLYADHPMVSCPPEEISLTDFKDDVMFILDAETAPGLQRHTVRHCNEAGFEPKIVTVPNLDTAHLWVAAKRGILATHEQSVCAQNPAFRFVLIPEFGETNFSFIWDKGNTNPSLALFLDFLRRYRREHR